MRSARCFHKYCLQIDCMKLFKSGCLYKLHPYHMKLKTSLNLLLLFGDCQTSKLKEYLVQSSNVQVQCNALS